MTDLHQRLLALREEAAGFAQEFADFTDGPPCPEELRERGRATAFAHAAELAVQAADEAAMTDASTVEQKITAAMYAVEETGASRLLTLAVQMLDWAKSAVVMHMDQPLAAEENALVEESWNKLAERYLAISQRSS